MYFLFLLCFFDFVVVVFALLFIHHSLFSLQHNHERVMVIAHSMGGKVFLYFLKWVTFKYGKEWSKKYLHGLLSLAVPYLGAVKVSKGKGGEGLIDLTHSFFFFLFELLLSLSFIIISFSPL